MSSSAITDYLDSVCPSETPGFAWSVSRTGGGKSRGWSGMAVVEPRTIPVAEDTLYDLASLTKPLATALVALRAFDAGRFDLRSPVRSFPEPAITPIDLLRHDAGFPDWLPLYAFTRRGRRNVASWLMKGCPRQGAHRGARYSCPGYVFLGLLLEQELGKDLSGLFEEWVAGPLGLSRDEACFRPVHLPPERIAATELDGGHEASLALPFEAVIPPFATGLAWGEVNDGNSRFLGGTGGNAGLFGTLGAVEILCEAYLPGGGFLSKESLDLAWNSPHPQGSGQRRTAGWKAVGSSGWWANDLLPQGGIGHEGFTGTGVWMEPRGKTTYILLTNRIHPRHPGTDFGPVRAGFVRAARGSR